MSEGFPKVFTTEIKSNVKNQLGTQPLKIDLRILLSPAKFTSPGVLGFHEGDNLDSNEECGRQQKTEAVQAQMGQKRLV